jgi:sodium/hydrogen antiporter
MESIALVVIAVGFLAYGLVSGRLQNSVITAPIAFAGLGLLIGQGGLQLADFRIDHGMIHLLAEITLVMVLFSDAARIDLVLLRRDHNLPIRMLAVGMPLTIVLGAAAALLILPGFSFWEAALLAAILAPTDAALGQTVVSSPIVPVRIRQALNVESGLNDGIALPVILLFASFASAAQDAQAASDWLTFGLKQVTLGPLAGAVVGIVGAKLIDRAAARSWMTESFEGLGVLAVAALAYLSADLIGGNGFIAAFVAGLCFGNTVKGECKFLFEFAETEGQFLTLVTFMIFGASMLPMLGGHIDWPMVLYAVLSLTVIRMLPVALSLAGAGLNISTVAFLGWFGPRGLASILFALLILDQSEILRREEALLITILTVAISTVAHGVSAAPAARAYASAAEKMGPCEETRPVEEMPVRIRMD